MPCVCAGQRWISRRSGVSSRPNSRIVHPTGQSLIHRVPAYRVRIMFAHRFGKQIAAFALALGIFLSGVGPSWAVPAGSDSSMPGMAMAMSDMDMSSNCAAMEKSSPGKHMPCKGGDSSCAVCAACAVNVGVPQGFLPVTLLYHGQIRAVSREADRSSVATPPPRPPPILRV
jgi:hypothetical protein